MVVPALVAGRAREIGVAVLEVDVPDAIEIPGDRGQRIAAAVHQMARIEAEPQERRRGSRQQRVDFTRRLDVPGAVMVEHRPQAGGIPHRVRDLPGASGKRVPLGGAQAVHEAFVNFGELCAHLVHLRAVLEVCAPALENEEGGPRRCIHVELLLGEHARLQVCAPVTFEVVAHDARRLVHDGRTLWRVVAD